LDILNKIFSNIYIIFSKSKLDTLRKNNNWSVKSNGITVFLYICIINPYIVFTPRGGILYFPKIINLLNISLFSTCKKSM
jgi:hypothetical protein